MTKLLDIDMKEGMQVLTQVDRSRRVVVKSDIDFLASLEEICWRQKSKSLFIKEGDNNTRFFHRLANSHRRTNQIRGVQVEGVLYEDESEVTNQVVDFYKKLVCPISHSSLSFPSAVGELQLPRVVASKGGLVFLVMMGPIFFDCDIRWCFFFFFSMKF